MTLFDRLWAEINNPRGGYLAASHYRAVTGGGHILLGACAASGGVWWVGFAAALAYWLIKERGDLRRGGAWLDGAEDTLCVWIGTTYGPWWWPFMAVSVMGYIMAASAVRRL
jgi:hypothetical protein